MPRSFLAAAFCLAFLGCDATPTAPATPSRAPSAAHVTPPLGTFPPAKAPPPEATETDPDAPAVAKPNGEGAAPTVPPEKPIDAVETKSEKPSKELPNKPDRP
jgi:hypothetical protein